MHREAQDSPQKAISASEVKKHSVQCPKCKSEKVIKKGFRKTLNRGKQQRHICKQCTHSFTIDMGFWKMKNSEHKICQAIDTYYEGLSLRKVRRNFYKYAETKISHQTVLNWIHKYVYLIRENVKKLQPQLSGHYLTDETYIKCKGKYHNLGVVMDKHTRYVISTRYSESEMITAKDHIELWSQAKAVQRPRKLTSDSLLSYGKAFRKVFHTNYSAEKVEWVRINSRKTGKYNWIMERLWNNLKERIKIMRGFKAPWSAKLLIDGYFIWHNFIRPHMSLRTSPACFCGVPQRDFRALIVMHQSPMEKVF